MSMMRTLAVAALLAIPLASPPVLGADAPGPQNREGLLRVCADANNMPYSNIREEGFENALAELLATELGLTVTYTWFPQRRGFVRNTLNAEACDVVMGVPADYEMTATTAPYYRSSYVLVTRQADDLDDLHALDDPRLRELRIGVHTIGDDYANPPPAQALARFGMRGNVRGYSIYGDYSEPDPPRRLIDAVASGEIDVAVAWGPIAGWFARGQAEPLVLTPVSTRLPMMPMAFDIAVGLRRGDDALRADLEAAMRERRADIVALLAGFGVPMEQATAQGDEPERKEEP